MNKGTLTTLDFVISVLREHEKEMTLLSDKLEGVLSRVSGENLGEDVTEIHTALNDLKQKIVALDQKLESSSNSSMEALLKQLTRLVSDQNQNLSLLVEAIKECPTKRELEDFKGSIASFNSLIQRLVSGGHSRDTRY